MDTWVWIVVAAGVVAAVVLALVALRSRRHERLEERRTEAPGLRQEAEGRFAEAGRREAAARQEERRAELERAAGAEALARADAVDPATPEAALAEDASPEDRSRGS